MRADFGKGGESKFAGPGKPELAIKRRESISGTARCFRSDGQAHAWRIQHRSLVPP